MHSINRGREYVGRVRRWPDALLSDTRLSWVPWAQTVAALTVGGLSLAGFFAMAVR
jgi:hypothetical protein